MYKLFVSLLGIWFLFCAMADGESRPGSDYIIRGELFSYWFTLTPKEEKWLAGSERGKKSLAKRLSPEGALKKARAQFPLDKGEEVIVDSVVAYLGGGKEGFEFYQVKIYYGDSWPVNSKYTMMVGYLIRSDEEMLKQEIYTLKEGAE